MGWTWVAGLGLKPEASSPPGSPTDSANLSDHLLGVPQSVKLGQIPKEAEIVFHKDKYIYVMNATGTTVNQITFENPRQEGHSKSLKVII